MTVTAYCCAVGVTGGVVDTSALTTPTPTMWFTRLVAVVVVITTEPTPGRDAERTALAIR